MTHSTTGIVYGKTIELHDSPGLPDGEEVFVTVEARAASAETPVAGDGIKRAAGSWNDDPEGLDAYLEWNRQQRKTGRRPLDG